MADGSSLPRQGLCGLGDHLDHLALYGVDAGGCVSRVGSEGRAFSCTLACFLLSLIPITIKADKEELNISACNCRA